MMELSSSVAYPTAKDRKTGNFAMVVNLLRVVNPQDS